MYQLVYFPSALMCTCSLFEERNLCLASYVCPCVWAKRELWMVKHL